ncbi:Nmad5 family putative nucleotide modification protein [uncultured Microbulbifer sp.]|uniref:Nmad5 family putative nucleotide modification protein n=1 Tax=uncultured Microbulbifer sp. TaxID=348147 RepID=UPI002628B77E|nr:Nmad5 family putative nucleotide modification protein [uncultured Microbulbifer sp.]
MKSFPITKEMRNNIARILTSKAVEKEIRAIAKEADRLNTVFWKLYEKKLRVASGIPSTRWPELIQQEIATHVYQYIPRVTTKNGTKEALRIDGDSDAVKYRNTWLNTNLMETLYKKIDRRVHFSRDLTLVFTAPKPLASMKGGNLIDDPELIADIEALELRTKSVLTAARDFHDQVQTILNSCRTSKQLQELLPEGAKYLPEPADKGKNLVPSELAASVTEMLQKGIPPVQTTAA